MQLQMKRPSKHLERRFKETGQFIFKSVTIFLVGSGDAAQHFFLIMSKGPQPFFFENHAWSTPPPKHPLRQIFQSKSPEEEYLHYK